MTWAEFKKLVDARLAEIGKGDAVEIWYLDVSYPDADRVDVGVDPVTGGLAVD